MTAPTDSGPIPVTVANWPDRKRYSTTTIKTYVLDPAGSAGTNGKSVQIATYEPTRACLRVRPVDAAVAITTEPPIASPDTGAGGTAPQGGYLPQNTNGPSEEFYGPDAFWLNSLTTLTRVVVVKEYRTNGV